MSKINAMYMDRMEEINAKLARRKPLTDEERELYFAPDGFDEYLYDVPLDIIDKANELFDHWVAQEEDKF